VGIAFKEKATLISLIFFLTTLIFLASHWLLKNPSHTLFAKYFSKKGYAVKSKVERLALIFINSSFFLGKIKFPFTPSGGDYFLAVCMNSSS
jgi:hypothetical protein